MTGWMRATGENPLQLVRIRGDAFGYADLSDGFLRLIVIEGRFETDFFRIAEALLGTGGTFLDVGANHGLLSFGLAHAHGAAVDFHLFEPNARLVTSIEATRRLYPAMRCVVNRTAVSDTAGEVSFFVKPARTGESHIVASGGDMVPSIRLDDYLAQHSIERVNLLKVDVEGYELAVIRGARECLRSRRIEAVYFEYFEKQLVRLAPPAALIGEFSSLGYEVCFCRDCDMSPRGGATRLLAGVGLPLLPVGAQPLPPMTDLMAVPRERLLAAGR